MRGVDRLLAGRASGLPVPFQIRYHTVEKVDWESCTRVLDAEEHERFLARGWDEK